MKWLLVVFIVMFHISCQKEHNLGEDFNRLVGNWKSVEGDDLISMTVEKSGKINLYKSFERIHTKKIVRVQKSISSIPNFDFFLIYAKVYNYGFRYHINNTNDSIYFMDTGGKTEDFQFDYEPTLMIRTE
ncbi:MAG: hypothetical protein V4638_01215 [Bacteroidota bacterium]